ncbi:hypothetical protein [Dactylosporangium sp. CA-233914]|uniref:hypothetical protein n=1 Tax=Dactylosporangium sp. CA-233914 TaxID=3239934 RepID=UPI003D928D52
MDTGLQDLVETLEASLSRDEKNAIVIGFEASQALVGHSTQDELVAELLSKDAFVPSHLYAERILNRWSNLPQREKQKFLRTHVGTRPGRQPDLEAIQALALLVKQGYLCSIIATDPTEVLYRAIDRIAPMTRLECARFRPEVVEAGYGPYSTDAVFVDGGEHLLGGFEPNSYGFREDHRQKMVEGLHRFLSHFDRVYCWGWCALNVPFNLICPDRSSLEVHALGAYTVVDRGSRNPFKRTSIEGEVTATAGILLELSAALKLRDEAVDKLVGAADVEPREAGPLASMAPARPLLDAEVLTTFTSEAPERRITICGIEGVGERLRAGAWLYHELSRKGEPCFYREGPEMVELGRYIALQAAQVEHAHIVGVLTGLHQDEDWIPGFLTLVARWSAAPGLQAEPGLRITLFCPVEVPSQTKRKFPRNDHIHLEWHAAGSYFRETSLLNWLMAETTACLGSVDMDVLSPLAQRMISDVATYNGFAADMLAEALDLWSQELGRSVRAANEAGTDPGNRRAVNLVQMWADIDQRYRSITKDLAPDFDLEIQPVAVQANAGDHEVDLGPITKRPEEDEDDGSTG